MSDNAPIPAAQYLRMSTEHQQYSTENQMAVISQYATTHSLTVVRTYSDPARSGLMLKNRLGLRELLKDVATGETPYRAILVYDVSRWGRFQDTDESAHYEFLCKSAGIPVHYCAEPFQNDGSAFSLITKNLKRLMAAEYSRELGTKVLAGQKRLAELGFKQGGPPGYGFRRMLISSDRNPKQLLATRERKSISTDRVILAPGPDDEVKAVQGIFRMFTVERKSLKAIARELNRSGVASQLGGRWTHSVVTRMLSHPKYIGCNVFNQSTGRLGSPPKRRPRNEWVIAAGAHKGIVDAATFNKAQEILGNLTVRKTDKQLLDGLRFLLAKHRRLSYPIIRRSPEIVTLAALRSRFGSIRNAYRLVGYGSVENIGTVPTVRIMRESLLSRIQQISPDEISIIHGGLRRSRLQIKDGPTVAVLVGRYTRGMWRFTKGPSERGLMAMLARLEPDGITFRDFYLFPRVQRPDIFSLGPNNPWLSTGTPLDKLEQFCQVARELSLASAAENQP